MQRKSVPHVIVSLGADGALFVSPDAVLIAEAPPVSVVSTVGAGDSLLAGYLAGIVTGRPPVDCAKLATVFAWSALEDVARHPPSRELAAKRMERIGVRSLLD
jgi:1-phosphofructokinase